MAVTSVIERDKLFIGGEWIAPASDRQFRALNATTEELIGVTPEGTEADIDAAVAAARAAFEGGWGQTTPQERADVLNAFAGEVAKRGEDLARTVSLQNGMPYQVSSQFENAYAVGLLQYYAALAKDLQLEERRPSPLGFDSLIRREPIGVVAGIVPWNYPVVLSITKIGPALAAGCTLVLKPSPGTPLDGFILAECAEAAGVPAGVLNWVPADREVGAYLVSHPGINKVAFTGSTAAGRKIGAVCGDLLRPCSLELGGKSAAIILDDADMEQVVQGLNFASFANNGQTCAASTRILVPDSRYDEITGKLAEWAGSLKIGDPLDPETQIGPVASEAHRERVEGYIQNGKNAGFEVLTGGDRPDTQDKGWFVSPTIFSDVDNSATIAQEEIFGPVLACIRYTDEQDAIKIANDSDYGLGGSVWGSDSKRAVAVARQVITGTIGVNGYVIDMNAPFGGVKNSGIGREFGPEAIAGYMQLKSVYLPMGG
ncbi:MAG TPA: aldehyde dehydrogenase [Solirubrobacteraceae bacterium]|jgi:geranial dehydrogenase|nr:aldehyde dehydrogenase [Solirubrobacteraceae bacterium]